MASKKELQVAQKRELEKEETTIPARIFVPNADIYETKDGLNVVLEMPGVDKNSVDVRVEGNVLKSRREARLLQLPRPTTRNITSGTFREVFGFLARSTKTKSELNARTASCPSRCR